jgi:DNA-binding transcriptional regulator YbjK
MGVSQINERQLNENLKEIINNAATKEELEEVKKSVSDGKAAVANAITAKGIETATDATFEQMATNVESIITLDNAPGLEAATWTPGTTDQVIAAGNYLRGD